MYYAVHRLKDKLYYTNDGKTVKVDKTLPTIPKGTEVRCSSVNAADNFFSELCDIRKLKVTSAHFHSTGIAKGLEPEELVKQYWKLPSTLFKPFIIRPDIAELKGYLDTRNAVRQNFGDALRVILQNERNGQNVTDAKAALKALEKSDAMLVTINVRAKNGKKKKKKINLTKKVELSASKIRECQLFNEVAHIKAGWMWAAGLVVGIGGVARFPTISSLLSFCGEGVIEGKAVRAIKGKPLSYNPQVRALNWANCEAAIILHRTNPWRDYYDMQLALEIDKYNLTLPEDQPKIDNNAPPPHLTMRARRRVRKEILKRWWLACNNIPYRVNGSGKPDVKAQMDLAVAA